MRSFLETLLLPFSSLFTSSLIFSLSSGSVGSPFDEGILLLVRDENLAVRIVVFRRRAEGCLRSMYIDKPYVRVTILYSNRDESDHVRHSSSFVHSQKARPVPERPHVGVLTTRSHDVTQPGLCRLKGSCLRRDLPATIRSISRCDRALHEARTPSLSTVISSSLVMIAGCRLLQA